MFDITSDTTSIRTAPLTVGNNTQNAALCDRQGFEALDVAIFSNTITAAGAGITFKLQHSDTTVAGDFVDVPAGQFIDKSVAVDDDGDDNLCLGSIGYTGNLRYVRLVATGGASTNGVVFGVYNLMRAATKANADRVGATTAAT
jgi:hypothetical protein